MKNNIAYLTILFLLLVLSSCDEDDKLPDTALCTIDAKTMEENYITLKDINVENELDNRVISFTHKQMTENLEYLTAKAKELNIDEKELGFRVYFGAKINDDFEIDTTKGDFKQINNGDTAYSTVFFVATEKGESEDASNYKNVYEIPALDYGSSRRPPIKYKSNLKCHVHNIVH